MINPLARVVMQNVTKTTTDKKSNGNIVNKNRTSTNNMKSLDDLARGLKGETVEVKEDKTEAISKNTNTVKTMSFNDMARQSKGEKVETKKEYNINTNSNRVNGTKSLADLARNVKGEEVTKTSKKTSNTKSNKLKFNDLVGERKNSNHKNKEDIKVDNYIDSKDRTLISNVISGKSNASENSVKSTKVLNLSQAVSNIINR